MNIMHCFQGDSKMKSSIKHKIDKYNLLLLILLLLLIGSAIMLSLGVIGYYLAKIYEEVKRRPRYIVSQIIRGDHEAADSIRHDV